MYEFLSPKLFSISGEIIVVFGFIIDNSFHPVNSFLFYIIKQLIELSIVPVVYENGRKWKGLFVS